MFDQTELVEFIKTMPEFVHITEKMLNDYCEKWGLDVLILPENKNKRFYNPKDCVEQLYITYGMTCRLCRELHIGKECYEEFHSPMELWHTFMPEFPYSTHERMMLTAPALCKKCTKKYKVFRNAKRFKGLGVNQMFSVAAEFIARQINIAIKANCCLK